MNYQELAKKVENVNSLEEARAVLTDEELVYYMNNSVFYGVNADLQEGDECTVAEILRILGSKGYSVAHSSQILSAVEAMIERISRFRF